MNSRKNTLEQTIKYMLLTLCVFVLYILQGTPGFLQIWGVKPVFIIPFCINLAMLEEDGYSLIVYVVTSSPKISINISFMSNSGDVCCVPTIAITTPTSSATVSTLA